MNSPHLRLVDRRPPEPRLAVRITAFAGRDPHGRSRAFPLDEHDLDQLLALAVRLENRGRRFSDQYENNGEAS
jgi:hypothetical protein